GEAVKASPREPYLSLRLVLDPSVVTAVMVESGLLQPRGDDSVKSVKAVAVSALDANLLNASLRLVRLIGNRDEYRALAPLVIREIVYRLLTGEQAGRMGHLATLGGQSHRMARAVEK